MTTLLDGFKAHLNIPPDDTADDIVLQQKLDVACAWVAGFTAGKVDESAPAPVQEAARLVAAHLFSNREATLVGVTAQEMPFGVLDMLASYRAWAF